MGVNNWRMPTLLLAQQGVRIFFAVQQNNNDLLYINPNCKMVQDIAKTMYYIIMLQNN